MRSFLLCLPLLLSSSLFAQGYQPVYVQLNQLRGALITTLADPVKSKSPALTGIDINYMAGVGAFFSLEYSQPLEYWLEEQGTPEPLRLQNGNIDQISPENATREYNRLRVLAKELSHQGYSLERKIKSMSKNLDSLTEQQKLEVQNHIQQAEKQLALIESKKKQLQPKYKSFKQQAMTPDTEAAPPANNYFDMFEQIISQELCHATQLATLLRAQDSFVVTLKQTGPLSNGRYQDTNYIFKVENINSCIEQEISASTLIQQTNRHYF